MKLIFYIFALLLGLLGFTGMIKAVMDRTETLSPADVPADHDPRLIQLADMNTPARTGDYYVNTGIDYYFSGKGDENSMDETTYLTEYSALILDSIVVYMHRFPDVRLRVHYMYEIIPAFETCVPCSFEKSIKNYLVLKGIKEERIVCGYGTKMTNKQDDNLLIIKKAQPVNEYVLFVVE